jgi:hypothetical protein
MVLLTAPVIDGRDAAAFTLRDSTCVEGHSLAAGAACQLGLELAAGGAAGRRVARVFFEHDWVQGIAGLALIGDVVAEAPPARRRSTRPRPTTEDVQWAAGRGRSRCSWGSRWSWRASGGARSSGRMAR